MKIIRKIIHGIKRLFRRKSKGRYMNIHEAREVQKYKDYFGKRKY